MSIELPPLPRAEVDEHNLQGGRLLYTADQMRAYALAEVQKAVLAERERQARRLEESADRLAPPEAKRTNQVDRHVADVLREHAAAIRDTKGTP